MTYTTYLIISLVFDLIVAGLISWAAFRDAKTRIVSPTIQLSLLGTALAHFGFMLWVGIAGYFDTINVWSALKLLFAGILMFTIYITLVLIFKTGIGGADTKVTSIMALYLGLGGALVMIVGHFVSAIAYVIFEKVAHKKHVASVPLMVFILIGYIAALAVEWIPIILQ